MFIICLSFNIFLNITLLNRNSADRCNNNDDVLNMLNKLAFLFESIQVLNVPNAHI